MLTKEQLSDLRSLHENVVRCHLEAKSAAWALNQAQHNLEAFLWEIGPDNPENKK